MKKTYQVTSKIVLWLGEQGAWHFAHIDKKQSEEIKKPHAGPRRGFGAIGVNVTLGKTT